MTLRRRFGTLLAAGACALASPSGSAHAILVASLPQPNGTLPAGHVTLMLRYNSRIDPLRSRLVLVKPDRSEVRLAIARGSRGDELDSSADLAPGAYLVRWQALALDGHLSRGELPFRVVGKS